MKNKNDYIGYCFGQLILTSILFLGLGLINVLILKDLGVFSIPYFFIGIVMFCVVIVCFWCCYDSIKECVELWKKHKKEIKEYWETEE